MWSPFNSDSDLGVMAGSEGSSMMILLCYKACFMLVPPGAKVANERMTRVYKGIHGYTRAWQENHPLETTGP